MEVKKNPNADLRKTTGLFLNIGLIVSLLLVITAFEWRFYDDTLADLGRVKDDFEEMDDIPITEQPPPPPPQVLQQPEIIEVEDDEEIEDIEVELDVEIDDETVVEVVEQIEEEEEEIEEIFTIVEQTAVPPGGLSAFYKFVAKDLAKNYPERAKKAQIQGKVFVTFVVEKNGAITDIKILKGIGGGCDEAAMNAVKKYGKWNPGKQRGRPVRQRMNLPITFRIG